MTTNPLHRLLLDPDFSAADVPFDPAGTGLAGTDVDAVLTEIAAGRAFIDRLRGIDAAGDADRSFTLTDAGKLITGSPATARTFTMPPAASEPFPIPAIIHVVNRGPGLLTLAPGAGVTLEAIEGGLDLVMQARQIKTLIKLATNSWGVYGVRRPAVTLLATGVVSDQASLDLALAGFAGYRKLTFELVNWRPASDNVELWMRTSTDGGASFDASLGHYDWASHRVDTAPQGTTDDGTNSASRIELTSSVGNGGNEGFSGVVELFGHSDGATYTRVVWRANYHGTLTDVHSIVGAGTRREAADVDGVRFLFESGNIAAGSWALTGHA